MKQSKQSKKVIGISMRVHSNETYEEIRDCISHEWIYLLESNGYEFVLIPNNLENIENYLNNFNISGVIITGGNDIVIDKNTTSKTQSIKRDKTETKLIKYCIKRKLPILGTCRGMQLINLYFKGKLSPIKNHIANTHKIKIIDKDFVKLLKIESATVNSYHNQGISGIGEDLIPLAMKGKSVEALKHKNHKIMGIMWHPERNKKITKMDKVIFEYLFI